MTQSGPAISLKPGYDLDFATGQPVDMRKPEETVRQQYERALVEDYGYEKTQLEIEVYIQRGTKKAKKGNFDKDRADIVVYRTTSLLERDQHRDILGIVETKRPHREDGVRQLMSYMSAASCTWGVWTNGDEIEYLYKEPETSELKRNFIFQIPRNGETIKEMGRLRKDALLPARDLKLILRRIHKILYANTNISRSEKLGSELIRLIFAKIWDERYDPDQLPKFRVGLKDKPQQVKDRIQALFAEVRKELASDGVFDENEEITLDAKSLMWVVGQLERYSLLKTDKDVVGDAFEVFAEKGLVGEKGEFFTPREVVATAVALVDPQPRQRLLDPACGSGGFLIYALEHAWRVMERSSRYKGSQDFARLKQEIAEKYFFGIDKEIDLVKIAKAYMAIVGDGRGGIVQQNTLHRPEDFDGRAKELFIERDHFRKFDIIMTNPPFGSKIKVLKEDAASFKLGHAWKKVGDHWEQTKRALDTEPQILFVERCLDMLEDGGVLAIVLPETFFHARNSKHIINYLKSGNNIKAVVDLAHNTFRPYNNAKTCLVVLQKGRPQQPQILMAVAEQIGHDHQGRVMYRYDSETEQYSTNEVWDDTVVIREELNHPHNLSNKNVFMIESTQIRDDIYVPRYPLPAHRVIFRCRKLSLQGTF